MCVCVYVCTCVRPGGLVFVCVCVGVGGGGPLPVGDRAKCLYLEEVGEEHNAVDKWASILQEAGGEGES